MKYPSRSADVFGKSFGQVRQTDLLLGLKSQNTHVTLLGVVKHVHKSRVALKVDILWETAQAFDKLFLPDLKYVVDF